MNYETYKASLRNPTPPAALTETTLALWYDGVGRWEDSHHIAQDIDNKDGARIHAYLHRKEGDDGNAMYWYQNSGEPFFEGTLEEEWEMLVNRYL